jgi:pimeloyl-ACP methyl ester carboxylesterase
MGTSSPKQDGLTVRLLDAATADGGHVELAVHPVDPPERADIGVVHIHGKGGNFYSLPFRPLVPHLGRVPALHVSVNMRCHDLGYTRTDIPSADSVKAADVAVGGGWWEDLELGIHDIAAAVSYARDQGCRSIFLVGHSAGGFYAADYVSRDSSVSGLVLLSPLTSNKTNLQMWFPQEGQLATALAEARAMVAEGRGHHIIPLGAWYYGVSATTLLQRASEADGVWSTNLNRADVPLLVLWGSEESRGPLFRELVENLKVRDKQYLELPGGDHNYIGQEARTASHIKEFIADRCPQ